jgi:hypothetical protein
MKLFLVLSLNFGFSFAEDKLPCEDLSTVSEALDSVRVNFNKIGEIKEGDEVDEALGQIIDGLLMIAESENNPSFTRAVDSMTDAYNNMEVNDFLTSLDSVIFNIDKIYDRDCAR